MSATTARGALVVFGSGPGIGLHIASLFASRGFDHVVLLSRNAARLRDDADAVRSAAPGSTVDVVATDLSDKLSLQQGLSDIEKRLKQRNIPIEMVLFNAARVGESKVLEFPVEEIESDFRIAVSALYTVAQWLFPQFLELAQNHTSAFYKPTLLVTGGFLHREPFPPLFSLSAVKAAQCNLVSTFQKVYAKSGIHCAMILVGGFVSEEAKQSNPKNISEKAWELYAQEPTEWTGEMEIVDLDYEERVRWD